MTITVITDDAERNTILRRLHNDYPLSRTSEYVLQHQNGVAGYTQVEGDHPGVFIGWAVFTGDITRTNFLRFVHECTDWAFLNTPAIRLLGASDRTGTIWDNLTYLKRLDTSTRFVVDIGAWAKFKGVQIAIDDLNAAGQTVKANKLEALLNG